MYLLRRFLMVLILTTTLNAPARAWQLPDQTSLAFIPADAAFYTTSFKLGEQWQRFADSRAFAKLKSLPVVQMGLAELQKKWESEGDLAPMRVFFEQAENQQLVSVLRDAVAHEVFLYGDAQHGKLLGTLARMGNTLNLAQMQAMTQGMDPEAATQKALLDLLQGDPDVLKVPTLVIGFRLSNTDAANEQLKRLEVFLQALIKEQAPLLEGRFARTKIGEAEYLSLTIDGTMVPWDEALSDTDFDEDTKNTIQQKLGAMTVNISLGVRQECLLLAIGKDDTLLNQMGAGDRLVDGKQLTRLKKYFDKNVYSVGYVSGDFLRELSNYDHQLNQLNEIVKTALPMVPLIGEDVKSDLQEDAAQLFDQLKDLQVRPGAMAGISFEGPDAAVDTVQINWTPHPQLDDSKPLTILEHVGGDPIAFFAARTKRMPEVEEFARTWTKKLGAYIERIAVPMLDSEQQDLYERLKESMLPLVDRLAVANREQLQPAFADGQQAFVLDAKLTSNQWHGSMPSADEEVPLPEFSCVWGVSDAAKLREGANECFSVLQDVIISLSENMPDSVPPIQIPAPRIRETDNAKIYYYMIPPFLGLDPAIAPNAGLSDTALAISLVPQATQRILESQSPPRDGLLAALPRDELATAWQFKMHRLIQMARPWVRYGMQLAAAEGVQDPEIASQVSTLLDVLECIRTASGYSYFEDDALVSHSRAEFQDLD